ncbi:hypothetical protein BK816_08630 [Boudabousia tangfeifanii]|uniref:Mechanosensitive ion channel MscS domain-containing protein n=2 Tax=Boudabousia tangfeifanii TaxID=1912795 RepID=A0A1D9MMF8_9ACTO|nr:hypothetical protein BK816_08630 [Boudabousia tangfeifanii]
MDLFYALPTWKNVFATSTIGQLATTVLRGTDADDTTKAAVENAVDLASVLASVAAGAAVGAGLGLLLYLIFRTVARRREPLRLMAHNIRIPLILSLALVGIDIALEMVDWHLNQSSEWWVDPLNHGVRIAVIASLTWLAVAAAHIIEDVAVCKYGSAEAGRARRVTTQTQVLRQVVQAILVAIGIIIILLTFPQARTGMMALLSSAGVISIVAGIAAQNVLGNMFAGLQVAFTDSVRVGDVLLYDEQFGTVEEITLTYVVLRVWDEKRLIIPSKLLTEKSIQNWTRRHTQMLGTVELPMDWGAPVNAVRAELKRLLAKTDLWDGQTASVQVTDAQNGTMTVRVCVSADTPANLWDLRCYLRENLIAWTANEAPHALARTRLQTHDLFDPAADISAEDVHAQAKALEAEVETTTSASLREVADKPAAAAVKAGAKARKAISLLAQYWGSSPEDNQAENKPKAPVAKPHEAAAAGREAELSPSSASTKTDGKLSVSDAEQAKKLAVETGEVVVLSGAVSESESTPSEERLYSGSPQNEERSRAFQGPGEAALAEREAEIRRQNKGEDEEKLPPIESDGGLESGEGTELGN